MINPAIFKAYDIRGVYDKDFSADDVEKIIRGIYKFFSEYFGSQELVISLGRDMRNSSPEIYQKALNTLLHYPVKVLDLDLCSTPGFYYSVLKLSADAGIQITASHNAGEYNGIKFVMRKGDRIIKVSGAFGMDQVKEAVLSESFVPYQEKIGKKESHHHFDNIYVQDTIAYMGNPTYTKKYKIAVDTANAMGILYLRPFFERYSQNFQVNYINQDLDGSFPAHLADPLVAENLKPLQELVKKTSSDLGVAPDGDGDRIFFVDNQFNIINPTLVTALISDYAFSDNKSDTVVVDVRYTRNVEAICKKYNKNLTLVRVGHSFITEKVNEQKAYFAGESSGHYYFYDFGGAENSLLVLMYMLKAIDEKNKPVFEIVNSYAASFESGEYNFVLPDNLTADQLFNKLKELYKDAQVLEIDGFTAEFSNWRFNFRSSNTEPLVRLNLEADSKDLLKSKLNELQEFLRSNGLRPKVE